MPLKRPDSLVQLLFQEMRQRIASGAWKRTLPGMLRLGKDFGVSRETIEKTLEVLTREGWLEPAQHGQSRRIIPRTTAPPTPQSPKRVGWLAWRPLALMDRSTRESIAEVGHLALMEEVELFVAPPDGSHLRNVARDLETLLSKYPADAWIVQGGTLEMAEWFARCGVPCLAVGGRVGQLALAQIGFDMGEQIGAAVDHLTQLGHRRIILPLPPQTSRPGPPIRFETAFRTHMAAAGAAVSLDYNLPILDGTQDTWNRLLESLFQVTPPTAFILYSGAEAAGLAGFLHRRGLRLPGDVSLVVEADEPMLQWLFPDPTRIEFPSDRLARAIWKWLREALRGHVETNRQLIRGTFVPGQTTAPPPDPARIRRGAPD